MRKAQSHDRVKDKEPTPQHGNQAEDEEWGSSKEIPVDEHKDRSTKISLSYSQVPAEAPPKDSKSLAESTSRKCEEHIEMPLGKFMEVFVEHTVSRDRYWITCKDFTKDAAAILTLLQKELSKPLDKAFVPCVGSLCIAPFEGLPYRARVKSVKDSKATVFYLDYGNTVECVLTELRPLPQEAWEFKSQAVQMVLSPDSSQAFMNLPVGSELTVKAIKNQNGVVLVEPQDKKSSLKVPPVALQHDAGSSKKTTISMQLPPAIIDLLKDGVTAVCEVQDIIEKDEDKPHVVITVAFEDVREHLHHLFKDLPLKCQAMSKDSNFKPSTGELIVVKAEDGMWKRGITLEKDPMGWKIMLCEEGIVAVEKEVQPIPIEFQNTPYISAECHVIRSFVEKDMLSSEVMAVGSHLILKVLSKKTENGNPEVICNVLDGTKTLCTVKLLPWKPELGNSTSGSTKTSSSKREKETKPDSSLKSVVLKNGDSVKIVHFFNLSAIYVQPCDHDSRMKIVKLFQSVTEACLPVGGKEPLSEMPANGSIVGCKFEADGNHYRALVVNAISRDAIHVSYIDFGNPDVVKLDLICDIPDELKKVPAQAVRIALKGSFGPGLIKDVTTYLSELVNKDQVLKFVCPDSNLKSCDLLLKNGVSVSDKVKMLNSSWKKSPGKPTNPLAVEKVFYHTDLEEDILPVPSDKENYIDIQLVALSTPGKATLVVCRKDHPLLRVVYEEFKWKVKEYCEEQPNAPYVPRSKEMCFAKFSADDQWYRAYCADSHADGSMIFFVDFGNWEVVKHTNIRKMTREFMEIPLLAIMCNYKGFMDETICEEAENRLKELIQPMMEYSARVWKRNESQDIIVDFPEITEKLIAENHLDAALFTN